MAQHLISYFQFISARLFQVRSQAVTWYLPPPPFPKKMEWFIFQGQWGVCLFIWTMGGLLHMGGGSQLGISLGGLLYQYLAQLANAGLKSVKVNLINCHRGVCRINFYQIVTSDVLISLWQFDEMLFDNLGHVFIHWVHYWSSKGSQLFSEMLNPHQYNDFIDLVKRSFVAQVFHNTVL